MNRLLLMKIHALLAAFILPVALMYIVTGALYTWGIKGSYNTDAVEIKLQQPIQSNLEELKTLATLELDKRGMGSPEGKPKIKTAGDHYWLDWTGSSKDITLEPTDNALAAKLTIKTTTWYRNLVQLHKAKGGTPFKVYAVILSISILLLLVSGFIMAWQTKKLKSLTLITSILGAGSFLVLLFLS